MARKRLDIRDNLHLPRARRGTADATRERDHKTAMSTLMQAKVDAVFTEEQRDELNKRMQQMQQQMQQQRQMQRQQQKGMQ